MSHRVIISINWTRIEKYWNNRKTLFYDDTPLPSNYYHCTDIPCDTVLDIEFSCIFTNSWTQALLSHCFPDY